MYECIYIKLHSTAEMNREDFKPSKFFFH